MSLVRFGALIVLLQLAASCDAFGHSCTEIGCSDQLSLTLRPNDSAWSDGTYELAITVDDEERTCSFDVPADLPGLGSVAEIRCMPAPSMVWLQQDSTCMETRTNDAVSQTCTPIPGRFTLQTSFDGTPESIAIELERDGRALLSESREPSYSAFQPNGPDCGPGCQQAEIALTFMQ